MVYVGLQLNLECQLVLQHMGFDHLLGNLF